MVILKTMPPRKFLRSLKSVSTRAQNGILQLRIGQGKLNPRLSLNCQTNLTCFSNTLQTKMSRRSQAHKKAVASIVEETIEWKNVMFLSPLSNVIIFREIKGE